MVITSGPLMGYSTIRAPLRRGADSAYLPKTSRGGYPPPSVHGLWSRMSLKAISNLFKYFDIFWPLELCSIPEINCDGTQRKEQKMDNRLLFRAALSSFTYSQARASGKKNSELLRIEKNDL